MKKILIVLMALGITAASASAAINIQWTAYYGAYSSDAPNVTEDPSDYRLLDNYSVTWQLIYCGDNDVADAIDLSNGANGWVSGDDEVWATRTLAQSVGGANVVASDGSIWSNWMLWQSGGNVDLYEDASWITEGFIIQRVYEGSPAELSYYFETDVEQIEIGPPLAQVFNLDTGSAGFQPDQQIPAAPVPEPMTMSLMGLGALALAIRRRRS